MMIRFRVYFKAIALVAVLTFSLLQLSAQVPPAPPTVVKADNSERFFELAKNIEIFTNFFRELNSYYVDEIDPSELMRIGIDEMLASLDPYTNYISGADLDEYQLQTTGRYGGVGARIIQHQGKVIITEPYEGAPAQKAGLMAGDQIIEVDGFEATGKNSEEISQMLRGQPGTTVKVKVRRGATGESIDAVITRSEISLNNVPYSGMVSDHVGYIRLDQFTEEAAKNITAAFKKLKESGELKGIILDLRGNPGGLLNEAVDVSNIFIDRGIEIVSTRGKVKEVNRAYATTNKAFDRDIPLVVLINGGSASASEIVSGSVQDLDRGVVIGQRTFGKGLVQITRPLAYKARLKVTTSKYYIPSGRCIQAIDYSAKDGNGQSLQIPDSLRKVFYTKAGRAVKDGAGIEPDIEVPSENFAPITQSLMSKLLIFDYATIYRAKNASMGDPKLFSLSDAEYDAFIRWLEDKDYDYITRTEKMLNELIETARKEEYYDAISNALKQLEDKMKHDKNQDLVKHQEEIKMMLETEIASRYGYEKARIEAGLKYDREIKKALEVLGDLNTYRSVLSASR